MLRSLIAGLVGYALGMLPSSTIAARLSGGSGRAVVASGTGNPGALNTSHALGKKWGAAVAAADIGKGVAAGALGGAFGGPTGANVAATAAVIGHCHPLAPGAVGGKGVATSVGQVLATFPVYLPLDFAVAAGTAALPWWKQRTMAATTLASAVWTTAAIVAWRKQLPNLWGPRPTIALPVGAAISSIVIAQRFLAERDAVEAFTAEHRITHTSTTNTSTTNTSTTNTSGNKPGTRRVHDA